MLSALLRSGDIKDYTALGQDGMAVYTVASQLRDAIKFKRGKTFADYLAIPQRNDQGNKIDWYVPFESTRPDGQYLIIPWTSASQEERDVALAELNVFERTILELGKELANTQSVKGDQLLFARLLCGGDPNNLQDSENLKALRFPNPEHVYLVNDRPVITFWGFIEKNTAIHGSPFLQLQPAIAQETKAVSPSSVPTEAPVAATAAVATTAVTAAAHPCKRFWWILPLFLLLGFLAWFFRDLWLPKPEITLNLNTPQAQIESQDERIIPAKDCEERQVENKSYYYINNQWVDSEGVLIENSHLLKQINQTAPLGIIQCERIPVKTINHSAVADRVGSASGVTTTYDNQSTAKEPISTAEVAQEDTALPADGTNTEGGAQPTNESNIPETDSAKDENKGMDTTTDPTTDAQMQQIPSDNVQNPNTNLPPVDPNMDNTATQMENTKPGQENNTGLTIPADSMKNGNLDFLNGAWRAGAGIQDKTTGKPLRLNYSFSDGIGQVKLERGDGVQCVGDVSAKMQSGGLNLNSTSVAKCSDGSTYQLPTVSCKPGANSVADCQGAYGSGQRFPISMKAN